MDLSAAQEKEYATFGFARSSLLSFSPDDFSPASKDVIRGLLAKPDAKNWVALVAGVAGLTDQMPRLRQIADVQQGWGRNLSWAAHLALARLGSKSDIDYCVETVESKELNQRIAGLDQLSYIRQPEVVPILVKYLNDDTPIGAGPSTPVGTYALHALCGMDIAGFPIAYGSTGLYSASELKQARIWLRGHKVTSIPLVTTDHYPDVPVQ
jgi:hypothetical protein